ncbi:VOC family protein [Halorientalis litorea]|jgi:catechol 2,3-dioxygenase-like lactoylglutathione lyase family enzyme|uniref:VOC family protein n=1 Tax=Halorientalis litorea TaxID=2931977 RepID=UPI001FF13C5C|nr:VOC family protein [Halorientalis litorea]
MDLSAHHYGVTVSDLDRAVAFYRDTLGLDVLDRFSVGGNAFATGVGIEGAAAEFAHLDADGTRLELVSYDPAGSDQTGGGVNRPGAKHLGFEVTDIDAFHRDLSDDVSTVSEPQTTESGTTILFLRDPEGNLVEILEP